MRTRRGTQKTWLFHIGKALDTSCPCREPRASGDHIDLKWDIHRVQKTEFLKRRTWANLDLPDWRKEGDHPPYDAVESFFDYLYQFL